MIFTNLPSIVQYTQYVAHVHGCSCQIIIIVFETDCIELKSGWSRKTSETAVAHDGCNDLTCTTTAWFKYRYISIWYFILYARFLSVLARSVTISHIEQLCNTRPHDCTVYTMYIDQTSVQFELHGEIDQVYAMLKR